MKYLPRDTDQSSYWDVWTQDPVFIAEHGSHCDHLVVTQFSAMDKRSDTMQTWVGTVCVKCGYLVTCVKRD